MGKYYRLYGVEIRTVWRGFTGWLISDELENIRKDVFMAYQEFAGT
jgi:hypothetical protein